MRPAHVWIYNRAVLYWKKKLGRPWNVVYITLCIDMQSCTELFRILATQQPYANGATDHSIEGTVTASMAPPVDDGIVVHRQSIQLSTSFKDLLMVAQSTAAIMLQFYTRNCLKPLMSTHMVQTVLQLQLHMAGQTLLHITAFVLPPWCKCPGSVWAQVLRRVLLTSG
jgi:hypothetical protein